MMAVVHNNGVIDDDPDFASAALYNLRSLGHCNPSRFNSEIANAQHLLDKLDIVGFSELHASSAVAADIFFSHLRGCLALYHCSLDFTGMALCVSPRLVAQLGVQDAKFLHGQHRVFVHGAAHFFWYDKSDVRRLPLNIYLNVHSCHVRAQQLRELRESIDNFRSASELARLEIILGGDRNFVMDPVQYYSSAGKHIHTAEMITPEGHTYLNEFNVHRNESTSLISVACNPLLGPQRVNVM